MNSVASMPTIGGWLDQATKRLRAGGIDSARMDARQLLGFVTDRSVAQMIGDSDEVLARERVATLERYLQRRLAFEPVSRILGTREFYGRPYRITSATLDPRPDSETLIDVALDLVHEQGWSDQAIRIADIGTGTGCLLLTLLAELPYATGLGTDICLEALGVARGNAKALSNRDLSETILNETTARLDAGIAGRLGPKHLPLDKRVEFRVADSLRTVNESFHLLVANPPYIPHDQIAKLAPEVRCFDPLIALDGGSDGLAFYRDLAAGLSRVISGGWALFEIGAGQACDINTIFDHAGLPTGAQERRVIRDLAGIERVIAVQVAEGKT